MTSFGIFDDDNAHVSYDDGRTRFIHVSWVTNKESHPCGMIAFNITENTSSFVYHDDYQGPPLDPVNLNYITEQRRTFPVNPELNPELLHRVFLDYMPGPWGLNVLNGDYPELKSFKAVEKLYWLGTRTVGCMAFHVQRLFNEFPLNGASRLQEIRGRSVDFAMGRLPRLADARFDGIEDEAMHRWMLDGLAAFGGARPKCTFVDRQKKQWIAKFNLDYDPYNSSRIEHATAHLAKICKIDAVETRILRAPGANDILLVKRYDRKDNSNGHKISIYSMLEKFGVNHHSGGDYRMIFSMIDQFCHDPLVAKDEMIRRMLFNVIVNNTDDHLKNFELICHWNSSEYTLSPAFDVTIDPYPTPHATRIFGRSRLSLDDASLNELALDMNEDPLKIIHIRDELLIHCRSWTGLFKQSYVNEKDLKRLSRVFSSLP